MRFVANCILIASLAAGLLLSAVSAFALQQQQQQPATTPPINASAPPPPPAPTEQSGALRASTDLVRIDVEVTDKSGKPVKGLKAEQFSVSDDGKAQQISIFTFQDIEKMETAAADNSTPIVVGIDRPMVASDTEAVGNLVRDHRLMVLFFDLTSMQPDDILRAHDAAMKFVQKQMTSADLVSVVTFATRLTLWADFTNNRAILEKAVARLTPD